MTRAAHTDSNPEKVNQQKFHCTFTSGWQQWNIQLTGLLMASTIFPVMFLLAFVATAWVVRGSSAITVFRPTLEMSRSRSESENMLEQSELMTTSI